MALAGSCILLFLDGSGFPIPVSVGASLMIVFFLVLAGSFEGLSPGSLDVFLLIVLFTLAGSVFFLHRLHHEEFDPARVSSAGTVLYERPWGRGRVILVGTSRGKLVAHLPPSTIFREGDEVDIDGVIEPFGRSSEEGSFDEARFWKARGAVGKIRRPDIRLTRDNPGGILWLRRNLREKILLNLPPLMRGHLLAVILGGRDPDLAEKHSEWGTSHILAVSGLHAGVVVLVIFLLVPPGPLRIPAASLAMWIYILLAGASVSALRAGLMIQAGFTGRWLGRPPSAVNAVSVAGLILLFWRPWFFWDLGWRLSMTAALVLSCLFDGGARKGWVAAPVMLWLATAGMVTGVFGAVPVAGTIINILAVPFFSLLIPLAFFLAIPTLAGIPGGRVLTEAGEGIFYIWAGIADRATSLLPWAVSHSWVLVFSGTTLTSYLLLAGIGFRRSHAAVFAVSIAIFLTLL